MVLVVTFALQAWIASLPYHIGGDRAHCALMIVAGLVQAAVLGALLRYGRVRGAGAAAIVAGALLMAGCALSVAGGPDADAAAYAGYARLPSFSQAYAPPAREFRGGGFQVINAHWGRRLPPLDYGPLWLAFDRLTLRGTRTFAQALLVMRLTNLACLAGLALLVRTFREGDRLWAAVALNPALYFYFVIEPHNDVMPLLLVVAGSVVARTRPWLGALLGGAAGLMKIPFALLALFGAPSGRPVRQRVGYLAVLVGVLAAGSWLSVKYGYASALLFAGRTAEGSRYGGGPLHDAGIAAHVLAAAIALAAAVAAFARGAFAGRLTLSFSALGAVFYPWYLAWCLPYAMRVEGCALVFLAALPALSHVLDPIFSPYPSHAFAVTDAYYGAIAILAVWSVLAHGMPSARGGLLPRRRSSSGSE